MSPNDSKWPALSEMPVHEFKHHFDLDAKLEALKLTDKDNEETRALLVSTAKTQERAAFEEFCEDLEDYCVVVWNRKAYFTGDDGPEEIYGDAYSLMG
jgi:hypothetical protein